MDESKLSARKRRTNKYIQSAFIDLINEMPFRKITVSLLCERAEINKTTFYSYYLDLYDLMDSLCEKLFNSLFVDISKKQDPKNPDRTKPIELFVKEAVVVIKNNMRLCKVIFCHSENNDFFDRFFEEYKKYSMQTKKNAFDRPKEAALYLNYFFYGMLGICRAWLNTDCELSEDTVVEMISKNLQHNVEILTTYK